MPELPVDVWTLTKGMRCGRCEPAGHRHRVLAASLPALRAARVDPIATLRND